MKSQTSKDHVIIDCRQTLVQLLSSYSDRCGHHIEDFVSLTAPGHSNMNEVERELESIILAQPIDLTALRAFSRRKGGFQNNKMRIRVWPKLMDVNRYKVVDFRQEIDPHRDDSQVQCDVERSLWNIEITETWRDSYRERRRQALSDIIVSILCRNKSLHYYQVQLLLLSMHINALMSLLVDVT